MAVYAFDAAWLHACFGVARGLSERFFRFLAIGLARRLDRIGTMYRNDVTAKDSEKATLDACEKALAIRCCCCCSMGLWLDDARLRSKYEKTVQKFYRAPPLEGNMYPLIVADMPCVWERGNQQLSGKLYFSWYLVWRKAVFLSAGFCAGTRRYIFAVKRVLLANKCR